MVTPDYRATAIWLQLTSGDNQDMRKVVDAVQAYATVGEICDALRRVFGEYEEGAV